MIRVLIVDDEKMVRKGFVSVMPWTDHDMEVVGDVNSGKNALEFLANNPVDLVITDIMMPGMSGLELMCAVKVAYPDMWVVALTFYQDFEYVREALRLGAIDYILKTQLEKNQLDDILNRISQRIKQETLRLVLIGKDPFGDSYFSFAQGLVCLHTDSKPKGAVHHQKIGQLVRHGQFLSKSIRIADNLWLYPLLAGVGSTTAEQALYILGADQWYIVKVDGLLSQDLDNVRQALLWYCSTVLFYAYKPGMETLCVSYPELIKSKGQHPSAISDLKKLWSSTEWVINDQTFSKLITETEQIAPNAARIAEIFNTATVEWEFCLRGIGKYESLQPPCFFDFWYEWTGWLTSIRQLIHKELGVFKYGLEIVLCIMKAINLLHTSRDLSLIEENIAKRVGMSRSYFSRCFKDIVGKSYSSFLMDVRISVAKYLLENTNRPIYSIAEQVGYSNEKYFSRIFHQYAGMLPSEYRKHYKKFNSSINNR